MGRNALPANVHRLRGDPSKKGAAALDQETIRIPIQVPTCPMHLGAAARTEWNRITPHLVTAGLVTELDRAALAAYCQAWGEWAVLEAKVKQLMVKDGADALVDVTPSGYKQVAALAQARDRSLDRMLRFAKEFGLTPASRIQSTTGQQMALPGVPDDPMEGFLAAGNGLPGGR
ncbi:phage terminase small subunit P27 family [Acidovorax sp. LjRoot118]|uniref:phage terminase small subunit P27 family n=1 Tax=Acidovorax sp. LjRoot118 TaxID=3342256 RepID=UPI003ECDC297